MRTCHKVVSYLLIISLLLLVAGCGGRATTNAPVQVLVYASPTYDQWYGDGPFRFEWQDLDRVFWRATDPFIQLTRAVQQFNTNNITPNQFNIMNESAALAGATCIGYSGYGNGRLILDKNRIEIFYGGPPTGTQETSLTKRKILAIGMAHEMGHNMLPSGVWTANHSDNLDNVMYRTPDGWLPLLRESESWWPVWNDSQIGRIRGHFGN
jgi:hypothetical protein